MPADQPGTVRSAGGTYSVMMIPCDDFRDLAHRPSHVARAWQRS